MRADIVAICHSLDNGDLGEAARAVKAGAKLAIDLLADGVAASAPKFKRDLLRRALSVLDIGLSDVRLDEFFDASTVEVFEEEILLRMTEFTTFNDACFIAY